MVRSWGYRGSGRGGRLFGGRSVYTDAQFGTCPGILLSFASFGDN